MSIKALFLLFAVSITGFSQDEKLYRSFFDGKISDTKKKLFEYKILVESSKYMIDLDRDGIEDSIQSIKKDGLDFFRVNDSFGRMVFEEKLITKGKDSSIFKVGFYNIKKGVDVLIVSFYEGYNESSTMEGSARVYFFTITDNNLKNISSTRGPFIWMERERAAGKYYNRRYSLNVVDYNKDGVREISTSFNKISFPLSKASHA